MINDNQKSSLKWLKLFCNVIFIIMYFVDHIQSDSVIVLQ